MRRESESLVGATIALVQVDSAVLWCVRSEHIQASPLLFVRVADPLEGLRGLQVAARRQLQSRFAAQRVKALRRNLTVLTGTGVALVATANAAAARPLKRAARECPSKLRRVRSVTWNRNRPQRVRLSSGHPHLRRVAVGMRLVAQFHVKPQVARVRVQQLKRAPNGLGNTGDAHCTIHVLVLCTREATLFKHVRERPVRVEIELLVQITNGPERKGSGGAHVVTLVAEAAAHVVFSQVEWGCRGNGASRGEHAVGKALWVPVDALLARIGRIMMRGDKVVCRQHARLHSVGINMDRGWDGGSRE